MILSKNISAAVLIMSLFGFIANIFSIDTPDGSGEKGADTPTPFPDGTRITALYISESGDMRHPYYILRETADGVYMKKTWEDPQFFYYNNCDEDDENSAERFCFGADRKMENEYADVVKLDDMSAVRELEKLAAENGALGWDGYNESRKLPNGQLDGDFGFVFYLELSDGTSVEAHGGNTSPKNWSSFSSGAEKVFDNYLYKNNDN